MNSVRRSARPALVAAMTGSVLLSGCFVQTMNRPPAPTAREELATTVTRASQAVLASRYGIADKLLADFALQHPATPEGAEASYWRALYKLDPANQTATPRDAAALLDAYLADATTAEHRAEATTLRRIATSLDRSSVASTAPATASPTPTTTTGTQAPAAPGAPAATPNDRARDEELQRLRDELAKANAELDRIRRRLAQPKP